MCSSSQIFWFVGGKTSQVFKNILLILSVIIKNMNTVLYNFKGKKRFNYQFSLIILSCWIKLVNLNCFLLANFNNISHGGRMFFSITIQICSRLSVCFVGDYLSIKICFFSLFGQILKYYKVFEQVLGKKIVINYKVLIKTNYFRKKNVCYKNTVF